MKVVVNKGRGSLEGDIKLDTGDNDVGIDIDTIQDDVYLTVGTGTYKFSKRHVDTDDDYGRLHVFINGIGFVSLKELIYIYTHNGRCNNIV